MRFTGQPIVVLEPQLLSLAAGPLVPQDWRGVPGNDGEARPPSREWTPLKVSGGKGVGERRCLGRRTMLFNAQVG